MLINDSDSTVCFMCRQLLHEKGVTWKKSQTSDIPEFSYEWLEAELDTGMIPQIWTAKKLLLTLYD